MSLQDRPSRASAEVNGTRLAYEVAGHGRPLVLLHAGIADSRMWDDQFDAFARRFTVVRYDIRGFGRSLMAPGTYSDRDDLLGLLGALGIARTAVVGVSKGAMIALDFALDHPEMVDSIVLTSPALGGVPASQATKEFEAAVDVLDDAGDLAGAVELELRRWVDGPYRLPDVVHGTLRDKVRQMDTDNFNTGEEGEELPLEPQAARRLGEIQVPVLVIVGDGDVPEIIENAERLLDGIADSRQAVVHGTAHMLSMERPEEFIRIVSEFLDEL